MPDPKKVLCPECDTETEVTTTEDKVTGKCPKCKLNVGAVLTRDRYETALQKHRKRREQENNPQPEEDPFNI